MDGTMRSRVLATLVAAVASLCICAAAPLSSDPARSSRTAHAAAPLLQARPPAQRNRPSPDAAQLQRARQFIGTNEAEKALALIRPILERDPKQLDAIFLTGEAHYALKQYELAIEWFEKGLAQAPDLRAQAFNLGRSYELLGRYDDAEKVFLVMMQSARKPLSSKGHFGMGLVFDARGQEATALDLYTKALQLDPKNHRAMYKLAQADLKAERLDRAVDRFQQILILRPLHHGAAYNLGLALKRQGKTEESKAALERWRKIKKGKERLATLAGQLHQDPTHFPTMEAIADTHFELQEWQRAFDWYQRCLQLRPRHAKTVLKIGHTLRGAEQWEMAAAFYRDLVDRQPPVTAAVLPLIEALEKLGKSSEADGLRKRFAKVLDEAEKADRPEKSSPSAEGEASSGGRR